MTSPSPHPTRAEHHHSGVWLFLFACWERRVGAGQDNQRFRGTAAAHVAALLPVGLHQQHSADRYYDPRLVSASSRVVCVCVRARARVCRLTSKLKPSVIEKWCRATGIKPSKMMIPLSYACIFGGTCTIVGTSTNLIVVGLVAGLDPTLRFPFFEVRCSLDLSFSAADLITRTHARAATPSQIGYVGLPIVLVGLTYVLLISPCLLPDRESPMDELLSHPREVCRVA